MINYLPLIVVGIPLLGTLIVYKVGRVSERSGTILTVWICGVTFLVSSMMYPFIREGRTIILDMQTGLPLSITFQVDPLGMLVTLVSSFLWFIVSLYAVEYMKHKDHRTRYDIFSLLSLMSMLGVVLAGNLFTLYIFFELLAFLSYVMVIHEETELAMKAGLRYLFMGIIGGLILLPGIIVTYVITGTLTLSYDGLSALQGNQFLPWIFWAYIIGFGVKAGIFPVHVWLPDAHPVAPAPASALLSGVMIKAGAYGILRTIFAIFGNNLVDNLPMGRVILVIAVITMFLGSIMAIVQTEIKRLLAYSSIANMGYIILGAALLSPIGLIGAIIHIVHHAFMKGVLFLTAGAFIHQTGLREIDDLKGIGKRMPFTMTCFTMAALSMIGIPPFVGFISKWYLALGALQSESRGVLGTGGGITIVGFLLLSSLLNVIYYGPIIVRGWFSLSEGDTDKAGTDDPQWVMLTPLFILALCTLLLGIFPQITVGLAKRVVGFYF